jgi:tetratricopeptide (TPR) repeat protein
VHHRLAVVAVGIAAAIALPSGSAWAQNNPAPQAAQQESPYKDQGEYDISTAAAKETDPNKQIDKLKEWEQKYPESKLKARRDLMMDSALLKIATAAYGKTGPADVLDAGQKAAQQIVDNIDTIFSADNQKSIGATDDQWKQAKASMQIPALNVLGWVALQKKDYPGAEKIYRQLLTINPNDAQSAYYLGSAIISEKNVDRYSEAIYEIAHALAITGPTALPPALANVAGPFLNRVYATYHGDDPNSQAVKDDIAKLKSESASAPFPPSGYHIKNANEIAQEKYKDQAAFDAANPDIALWRQIKTALTAAHGETYFAEKLKDAAIPPEGGGMNGMFRAKVVSVSGTELVASVDNAGGDATLKFEHKLNEKAINQGDAFQFKGVATAFTKDPYMLTLTIDDPKEDIKGLPANAFSAAPPTKKAPVRKAAPKKKS